MARLLVKSLSADIDYTDGTDRPVWRGNWMQKEREAEQKWADEFRSKHKGDLVGEILEWPRADGSARYMIACQKPLHLAHIDFLDGYTVENALIRGLSTKDVREMVDRKRRMDDLFGRPKKS
jgi:hypothetical protein